MTRKLLEKLIWSVISNRRLGPQLAADLACVKVNGDVMRLNLFVFTSVVLMLIWVTPSVSGNKWMMEKNRDELLLLNAEVLEQLGHLQEDGEIVLKGSVVYQNGKIIVRIHQLEKFTLRSGKKEDNQGLFEDDEPFKVFLRDEPLPEIQLVEEEKDKDVLELKQK